MRSLAFIAAALPLAAAGVASAQTPGPLAPQMKQLVEFEAAVNAKEKQIDQACSKAAHDLAALDQVQKAPVAAQVEWLIAAAESRTSCQAAKDALKTAKDHADRAWALLHASALALSKVPATTPSEVQKALLEAASKAQGRVNTARAKFADPYEATDQASSLLVAENGLKDEDLQSNIDSTIKGRASAAEVRGHLRRAQSAANRLVEHSLNLRGCSAEPCAKISTWAAAGEALEVMNTALSKAETTFNVGKEAGRWVTAGVNYPNDPTKRPNAVAFAKLLEASPDARALLGESSALGFSASGGANSIAVKLGSAKDLPLGWRQWSVTFKAPLAAESSPQLYSQKTGFNNAASLGFSTYWLLGGKDDKLFSGDSYLTVGGLKGDAGLGGKLKYRDVADITKEKEADRLLKEGTVGAYFALFTKETAQGRLPGLHLLTLDYTRKAARGDKQTRCPATPATGATTLNCITDYFAAPEFERHAVLGYEYRLQGQKWAIAPKISFDHKKTDRFPPAAVLHWHRRQEVTDSGRGIRMDP